MNVFNWLQDVETGYITTCLSSCPVVRMSFDTPTREEAAREEEKARMDQLHREQDEKIQNLLYDLQPTERAVYDEIQKILDEFGSEGTNRLDEATMIRVAAKRICALLGRFPINP